jgi:pyrroloquinoline quinone biosynthesis protein D
VKGNENEEGRPQLAPQVRREHDQITGEAVLLFPEGILVLNETANEILAICDGTRNIGQIVAVLSEQYEVPTSDLIADVRACLQDLEGRRLVQFIS